MSKKPIIVFEGIEGSGKSYHINNVANFLKKKKINFVKIREPGGSQNSEKIRDLLMNKNSKFDKITDLMLYMAARNENYINTISRYKNKKIILIDRFIDSTIAYQHFGMGIDINFINLLNKKILKKTLVNFTFLHTVSINNLKLRLKKRKSLNRYDTFKESFYRKVQKGFLNIAKKKRNYLLINSNFPVNHNKNIIINKVKEIIL
tara:strand:- start:4 stop:618 length:615 start_codon:yes stop_codon:yes gene_type:complete